jgi:sulfatase maturation enzyme AslB (radical SAM superfamily)
MDEIGGCSYCCIQDRNTSNILTFEQVDEFFQNVILKEEVNVVEWFGGEPTIHFDIISKIVSKYPDYKYRLYTNGLFDFRIWKDTLFFFSDITISHDGPDKYNRKRGISNNSYASTKCIENIENCLNFDFPVTIAIVPSTSSHYENLDILFAYFRELGVQSFSLEIPSVIQDEFVNKKFTSKEMNKIIDYFYDKIVDDFLYGDFKDKTLFNIPKEHYPGQLNIDKCSETNIALSPTGKIYHCRDTAANEEKLVRVNRINFYSSIPLIKDIETYNTCHVKMVQGYTNEGIVNFDNILELKAMYEIIKLMNAYYYHYCLKDSNGCESCLDKIEEIHMLILDLRELKKC